MLRAAEFDRSALARVGGASFYAVTAPPSGNWILSVIHSAGELSQGIVAVEVKDGEPTAERLSPHGKTTASAKFTKP